MAGTVAKQLESGVCGVQWRLPAGTVIEETERAILLRDPSGLGWHVQLLQHPFAAAAGEEAALRGDLEASARDAFEAHWAATPNRHRDEKPRTADHAWSPVIETGVAAAGGGRIVRVVRRLAYEPTDEIVTGHLIVPVSKGTVEIRVIAKAGTTGMRESVVAIQRGAQPQSVYDDRALDESFPDHPLTRVRVALELAYPSLAITGTPTRKREVVIEEARCAIVPPPRFVPMNIEMAPGLKMFWRAGLDHWKRLLDVWQLGNVKLKGKDLRPPLATFADQIVNDWQREGASDIQIQTRAIADFAGKPQIEQYVRFRAGDDRTHTLHRWWVDKSNVVYRIGSNGPLSLDRAELLADLDQVQASWRAL